MNIIIVADKGGANRHASLSHRHVLVMALVGLFVLPVFLGGMTYQIRSLLDRHNGVMDAELVTQQQKELHVQRVAIQTARRDAETHLNVWAWVVFRRLFCSETPVSFELSPNKGR